MVGYDDRYVRDSVHRLDRLAKDFEREVDRSLDRSRRDGTRSEDRINDQVRQFRNAVSDLKSRVGNGRDLNRSRDEAQRVLQEGRQLDRIGNRLTTGVFAVVADSPGAECDCAGLRIVWLQRQQPPQQQQRLVAQTTGPSEPDSQHADGQASSVLRSGRAFVGSARNLSTDYASAFIAATEESRRTTFNDFVGLTA